MKEIRNYITSQLDELKQTTPRNEYRVVALKQYLTILSQMESDKEANILKFNADGSFHVWCLHVSDDEKQYIEEYDTDVKFETYAELLSMAKCMDVTDTFSTKDICHLIHITNDLSMYEYSPNIYYMVSNQTIDNIIAKL